MTNFKDYKAKLRGLREAKTSSVRHVGDEHQGYSNYDTFQVAVVYDNDQQLYNASRQLVRNGGGPDQLRDWAEQAVIGPLNKSHMNDAQEWNDVPQDERLDHNYEGFKDKHGDDPKAMDLLHGLVGGPNTDDMDPSPHMINPSLVNWQELWTDIRDELAEEAAYNQPQQPQPAPPQPDTSQSDLTLPEGWQ